MTFKWTQFCRGPLVNGLVDDGWCKTNTKGGGGNPRRHTLYAKSGSSLTPSLPWFHWKSTHKSVKFETLKSFCLLFSHWHVKGSPSKRTELKINVTGLENIFIFRRVRGSFILLVNLSIYLTGILYAVVRQISMLFVDNKISVSVHDLYHSHWARKFYTAGTVKGLITRLIA